MKSSDFGPLIGLAKRKRFDEGGEADAPGDRDVGTAATAPQGTAEDAAAATRTEGQVEQQAMEQDWSAYEDTDPIGARATKTVLGMISPIGLMAPEIAVNAAERAGMRVEASKMGSSGGRGDGTPQDPSQAGGAPGGDPAASPISSVRYVPETGDYEKIFVGKDGARLDASGNPITWHASMDPARGYAQGGSVLAELASGSPPSGLLNGSTPGRADAKDAELPDGSYIIPASEVAAAGDGNTHAGALALASRLSSDGRPAMHDTIRGGTVPARVADGEFFVAPHDVERAGGADALDKLVKELRAHYIKKLRGLPGPRR